MAQNDAVKAKAAELRKAKLCATEACQEALNFIDGFGARLEKGKAKERIVRESAVVLDWWKYRSTTNSKDAANSRDAAR